MVVLRPAGAGVLLPGGIDPNEDINDFPDELFLGRTIPKGLS